MDQLATEEVAAPGGDPVIDMDAPEVVAEEVSPIDELYPDEAAERDAPADDEQGDDIPDEEGEPEAPAIDPPHSWKAEDKAKWDDLPREAQEIIARRETEVARAITAKSEEAKTARETVVEQAKTEIATFREQQAAQIRQYAALFTPEPPDERLLYTGNPQDAVTYQQQQAAFMRSHAQQQQLQQAAQYEEAQAQLIRDEQTKAARAADEAKLREQWPEWFMEGDTGQKLQSDLKSIALDIGYPEELWEERNAADVLALRKVADWKAKAAKWDSYDRNRRAPSGQFRQQRQLPPVTRPGAQSTAVKKPADPLKLQYPND